MIGGFGDHFAHEGGPVGEDDGLDRGSAAEAGGEEQKTEGEEGAKETRHDGKEKKDWNEKRQSRADAGDLGNEVQGRLSPERRARRIERGRPRSENLVVPKVIECTRSAGLCSLRGTIPLATSVRFLRSLVVNRQGAFLFRR
jgi:hypothetical protein